MPGQKKVILLTGGTGFLGSHLVRRFVEQGHELVLLKRVSSDMSRLANLNGRFHAYDLGETALNTIFDHHAIDLIVHCATHYGRAESSPIPVIEANLILPLSLLHQAITRGVKRFVNTDTVLDPGSITTRPQKASFWIGLRPTRRSWRA